MDDIIFNCILGLTSLMSFRHVFKISVITHGWLIKILGNAGTHIGRCEICLSGIWKLVAIWINYSDLLQCGWKFRSYYLVKFRQK